jgi:geranylgeranyl pyrophosphate synthase
MPDGECISADELRRIVEERSSRILGKFGEKAVLHVTDTRFLAAIEDIKSYWKDFSRPALVSFSCEAVGGCSELSDIAGVMFVLASSGFGIHDDILDKSVNKHLRMTILGLHGFETALLFGDLLIGKALTVVRELIKKTSDPMKVAKVLEVYEKLCVEVCEAELMETQCRRNMNIDVNCYTDVLWKAMAETEACSRIGAMLGNGNEEEIEALGEFGRRLGFMSRLADDVEDCLNIKGDLVHRIEYESLPLPLLYAAESSAKRYSEIKKIVEQSHVTPLDVKMLLRFCFEAEAFEKVRKMAKKNEAKAIRLLDYVKTSDARNVLLSMVKLSFRRVDSQCI